MEKKKHLKHRTCYVSRHMSAPRLFKKRKEQKKKRYKQTRRREKRIDEKFLQPNYSSYLITDRVIKSF